MNTISTAICEDEPDVLKYLVASLQKRFSYNEYTLNFDTFTHSEELLYSVCNGKNYEVLFLDIEMPKLNGLDLSKKLIKLLPNSIIIFISNKEELVFQTFEVRPFRFVRKNHFTDELPSLVADVIKELAKHSCALITLQEKHSCNIYTLPVEDIIYIEVISKYCKVVSRTGTISLRFTISEMLSTVSNYGFLQPHRSYLVNYRYIFNINKSHIILDNKETIPLSRNRIDSIKHEFITLVQGGIND